MRGTLAMTDGLVPSEERPTADHLATARRLRELHRLDPEAARPVCWWCLKAWPCPDELWAARTEERARRAAG
jgi:hypothetical protein